jgi:hypothetical protein
MKGTVHELSVQMTRRGVILPGEHAAMSNIPQCQGCVVNTKKAMSNAGRHATHALALAMRCLIQLLTKVLRLHVQRFRRGLEFHVMMLRLLELTAHMLDTADTVHVRELHALEAGSRIAMACVLQWRGLVMGRVMTGVPQLST